MTERIDAATVETLESPDASAARVARVRQAYLAIALLIAAIVGWGFWATYYSRLASRADLPSIVQLHAAVFSAWVLILVAQAVAVAGGRIRIHRQLGAFGMAYGAVVFAVGLLVSVGAPALRVRDGQFSAEVGGIVVLYNLADMLLFGVFLALAYGYRNRSELHKRWIVAATAALCGAAIGRLLPSDSPQYLLLWLSPILAMVAVDLATGRRVHWIPLVSGALLVVAFFKVPLFAAPVWREIGRLVLRPFV